MRISFCLPQHGKGPIGGFKVVYEYANGLSARGHEVHVVHPALLLPDSPPLVKAARLGRFVQRGLTGDWRPGSWFKVSDRVQMHWVPSLHERYVPDSDVVVATGWQTAEWIARYSPRKGRPYYLIQHYENWSGPEARVEATWRLPFRHIVIAKWLAEYSRQRGQSPVLITNGLDFKAFGVDIPPAERNPASAMALCHPANWKGSADAIKAFEATKEKIPELQVTLFGAWPKPRLPSWITYHQQPSQERLRRLYNETAIFVAPSLTEGWALPPAEAMICGAALVATDIGGHRDYAIPGQTALLAQPGAPSTLAEAITRLIRNPELRHRLALEGQRFLQPFTWEVAVNAFERALLP